MKINKINNYHPSFQGAKDLHIDFKKIEDMGENARKASNAIEEALPDIRKKLVDDSDLKKINIIIGKEWNSSKINIELNNSKIMTFFRKIEKIKTFFELKTSTYIKQYAVEEYTKDSILKAIDTGVEELKEFLEPKKAIKALRKAFRGK